MYEKQSQSETFLSFSLSLSLHHSILMFKLNFDSTMTALIHFLLRRFEEKHTLERLYTQYFSLSSAYFHFVSPIHVDLRAEYQLLSCVEKSPLLFTRGSSCVGLVKQSRVITLASVHVYCLATVTVTAVTASSRIGHFYLNLYRDLPFR